MSMNFPYTILPYFSGFVGSSVIPQLYWNVYSDEQRIKEICQELGKVIEYVDVQTDQININSNDIYELQVLFQKFMESGFEDYYKEQIAEWISTHLLDLWKTFAKQVYFGLTDDGYFCAYVPESWSDIIFDTGAEYGTDTYGHLILRFDATGSGIIDNTHPNAQIIERLEVLEDAVCTPLKESEVS